MAAELASPSAAWLRPGQPTGWPTCGHVSAVQQPQQLQQQYQQRQACAAVAIPRSLVPSHAGPGLFAGPMGCVIPPNRELCAEPARVLPSLYLGSWSHASNQQLLQRLGVTHVLNATKELPCPFSSTMRYLHHTLDDIPAAAGHAAQVLPDMCSFISQAHTEGGTILVHCYEGRSRSVTAVLAYLIACQGMSLADAIALVKSTRFVASPNVGFFQLLLQWEQQQRGHCSLTMEDFHVVFGSAMRHAMMQHQQLDLSVQRESLWQHQQQQQQQRQQQRMFSGDIQGQPLVLSTPSIPRSPYGTHPPG